MRLALWRLHADGNWGGQQILSAASIVIIKVEAVAGVVWGTKQSGGKPENGDSLPKITGKEGKSGLR